MKTLHVVIFSASVVLAAHLWPVSAQPGLPGGALSVPPGGWFGRPPDGCPAGTTNEDLAVGRGLSVPAHTHTGSIPDHFHNNNHFHSQGRHTHTLPGHSHSVSGTSLSYSTRTVGGVSSVMTSPSTSGSSTNSGTGGSGSTGSRNANTGQPSSPASTSAGARTFTTSTQDGVSSQAGSVSICRVDVVAAD